MTSGGRDPVTLRGAGEWRQEPRDYARGIDEWRQEPRDYARGWWVAAGTPRLCAGH